MMEELQSVVEILGMLERELMLLRKKLPQENLEQINEIIDLVRDNKWLYQQEN